MSFRIYDLLHEADDDNTDNNSGGDEDFSIDSSMDDSGDDSGDSTDMDDLDLDDSGSSDDSSTSSGGGESEEENTSEEAVENNTSLFNSLSAEEQSIKIRELKDLFAQLYSAFDDISDKISELDINESNKSELVQLNMDVYNLKIYIKDYIIHVFPNKSYLENDIAYNRFLDIINTMTEVLNVVQKKESKLEEENNS